MFLNDQETATDLLYYEAIAKTVVRLIRETPTVPVTIGVHGDWGAGKSSVLKMTEAAFAGDDRVLCLWFNGWTFEGFEDAKTVVIETIVDELRRAILIALESFDPTLSCKSREACILSNEEIAQAVLRIKGRSNRPWHDIALFYVLFATGARPLEIARLEVRDYLDADGHVRRESQMRVEVAITRKPRSLYFTSTRLDEVLTLYLQERRALNLGVHTATTYRGLDPDSRLFLSATGEGFKVTPYGKAGQMRFLCRPILETYDKLFRYAEIKDVSARSARRTVVSRLYERGALGWCMTVSGQQTHP
ncbi:P-loop NTPase fold protein [Polaromonas sp.]|uniref:P-loop NTPase fold protein n=1 Tax=Polaromonas sp. TaxID=1869339 RepID=UPI002869F76F|nr:P-loop NTPase fold protein [Polaromonas sp.]